MSKWTLPSLHLPQVSAAPESGARQKTRMWPEPCKSLTSNVHPPLIKRIKYSFWCCGRNASHTSDPRGNKRIKATSSSGRSGARALGSRCTWQEGGKKMLWLWQLLFSICTMCSQGRAGDSSWSRECWMLLPVTTAFPLGSSFTPVQIRTQQGQHRNRTGVLPHWSHISVHSAMPWPDSQVRAGEKTEWGYTGKKAFYFPFSSLFSFPFHSRLHVYLCLCWVLRLSSFF